MAVRAIIEVPHPTLRTVATPITAVTPQITQLLDELTATLQNARNPIGVGLAAPQIDEPWRVFATQLEHPTTGHLEVQLFLNPVIIDQSDRLTTGHNPRRPDLEGCLSIPLYYGPVERPEWVTLQWQEWQSDDRSLSPARTQTFYDFTGRVIQHELDHLNGVLFTDHIRAQKQSLFRAENDDLIEVDPEVARDW